MFKHSFGRVIKERLNRFTKTTALSAEGTNSLAIPKDLIPSLTENLIEQAVKSLGVSSLLATQEEFFKRTGKVFVEDSFYDVRMNYFFDIFIFEEISRFYPEISKKIQPFSSIFDFLAFRLQEEKKAASDVCHSEIPPQLAKPIHSIFKVSKAESARMWLRDCLRKKSYVLTNRHEQLFHGIEKLSYIQGFIYPCTEGFVASSGLIVHSPKCNSAIRQALSKFRKAESAPKDALLDRLAHSQLQQVRMRHVNPTLIYKKMLSIES